jgi:hypothetical protein
VIRALALVMLLTPVPPLPTLERGSGGEVSRSVWDSVYTVEQAERGAAFYQQACARCHGSQLTGGEMAPPLVGVTFLSDWNGTTVGDVYERVRVTMPVDNPGSVPRPQIVDILALLLRANGFPAGKAELPRGPEALQLIRIEATRP